MLSFQNACLHKIWCTLAVGSIAKSYQEINKQTNKQLQIKWHRINTSCRVKFCILTPKILFYYYLRLHRVSTTAIQIASPVSEIMDTLSYPILYVCKLNICKLYLITSYAIQLNVLMSICWSVREACGPVFVSLIWSRNLWASCRVRKYELFFCWKFVSRCLSVPN
jgi:hypothetical protein